MANYSYLAVVDYETTGKNAQKCQPMSMACTIIDPVRLEILSQGDFYSLIKCSWDKDWCDANNTEVPQEEALAITKLTREDNEKAPSWQEVHTRFEAHIKKFYTGTGQWKAPLFAGFNSDSYDYTIMSRACEKWGSWDKVYQKQGLFHPIHSVDAMKIMWLMTEARKGWFSLSLDTIRKNFGLKGGQTHNALADCRDTAALLIKTMKWFRQASKSVKLEGCFEGIDIFDFYDTRPTE